MALQANSMYIGAPGMVTPFGSGLRATLQAVLDGKSGLRSVQNAYALGTNVHCGLVDIPLDPTQGTRLDAMLADVYGQCLTGLDSEKWAAEGGDVIVCTTKGNIDLLMDADQQASALWNLGQRLSTHAGHPLRTTTISHACISGMNGLMQAELMVRSGRAKHVLVLGADLCSRFTLSGFLCLQAISKGVCSPYDAARDGINLGDAVAGVVVSADSSIFNQVMGRYLGGGAANDANHISGPSRTGEGLVRSINMALERSGVANSEINLISAHGTATIFNDEMESIAFGRLGLDQIPTHSLKPFFGHTLGAAGVLETIVSLGAFQQGWAIGNINLQQQGVSVPMHLPTANTKVNGNLLLKTGSGFGGCNAAYIIEKV